MYSSFINIEVAFLNNSGKRTYVDRKLFHSETLSENLLSVCLDDDDNSINHSNYSSKMKESASKRQLFHITINKAIKISHNSIAVALKIIYRISFFLHFRNFFLGRGMGRRFYHIFFEVALSSIFDLELLQYIFFRSDNRFSRSLVRQFKQFY